MYLVLDLETTGLDPVDDRILEVGWAVANYDFTYVTSIDSSLVDTPYQALSEMEPYVREMHEKSGLLRDLEKHPVLRLEDIEDQIFLTLHELGLEKEAPLTLAGVGVHFDKAFIAEHMPRLHERLHYRIFEIRTLVSFFEAVDIEARWGNDNAHRAASDVQEAISVVKGFFEHMRETSNA